MTEHARSGALHDELSYWCALVENSTARLPLDYIGGNIMAAAARTVSVP